jgi:hypothetical protein
MRWPLVRERERQGQARPAGGPHELTPNTFYL